MRTTAHKESWRLASCLSSCYVANERRGLRGELSEGARPATHDWPLAIPEPPRCLASNLSSTFKLDYELKIQYKMQMSSLCDVLDGTVD